MSRHRYPQKLEDGDVSKGSGVRFRELMRNDEDLKIYEDSVEPFVVSCALCLTFSGGSGCHERV